MIGKGYSLSSIFSDALEAMIQEPKPIPHRWQNKDGRARLEPPEISPHRRPL